MVIRNFPCQTRQIGFTVEGTVFDKGRSRDQPMDYGVRFVNDDELQGQEWLMIEDDGDFYLFVARSSVCPRVLTEAWAAYRRLTRRPSLVRPGFGKHRRPMELVAAGCA